MCAELAPHPASETAKELRMLIQVFRKNGQSHPNDTPPSALCWPGPTSLFGRGFLDSPRPALKPLSSTDRIALLRFGLGQFLFGIAWAMSFCIFGMFTEVPEEFFRRFVIIFQRVSFSFSDFSQLFEKMKNTSLATKTARGNCDTTREAFTKSYN